MLLSSRKIGPIVLMLVLVHLFAPALHAVPPSERQEAFRYGTVFTAAWDWLGSLLLPAHEKPGIQEAWRKAGSQMDPNGMLQGSDFASGWCEAGSQMDPNGYN